MRICENRTRGARRVPDKISLATFAPIYILLNKFIYDCNVMVVSRNVIRFFHIQFKAIVV